MLPSSPVLYDYAPCSAQAVKIFHARLDCSLPHGYSFTPCRTWEVYRKRELKKTLTNQGFLQINSCPLQSPWCSQRNSLIFWKSMTENCDLHILLWKLLSFWCFKDEPRKFLLHRIILKAPNPNEHTHTHTHTQRVKITCTKKEEIFLKHVCI